MNFHDPNGTRMAQGEMISEINRGAGQPKAGHADTSISRPPWTRYLLRIALAALLVLMVLLLIWAFAA